MALDGLVVSSLAYEFEELLDFNRIEKIYQPEDDEIIINLRSNRKGVKLLLSANSNYPRVHFTNVNKDNPAVPPNFCMLLRKYLQGGKIVAITQPNFERIIKFRIETLDELNMVKYRELIIEMMGRHSNIILINCEDNKILDSIKRVPFDVSRYRQILPGLKYTMPPAKDKYNPLEVTDFEDFKEKISNQMHSSILKGLYTTFVGISPLIAREICFLADLDGEILFSHLLNEEFNRLFLFFSSILNKVKNKDFLSFIYIDQEDGKYIDFSVIDIKHLAFSKQESIPSVSTMLEVFYANRDQRERIKQKSYDLRKSITTKLDRLYNKMQNLHQDLKKAEKGESYKIKGELLTANLYKIQKGDDCVEVIDYYDENQKTVEIQLDKRLSPSQNAQSYYKKYNKAKNALIEVDKQLEKTKDEIQYLEQIVMNIDQSTYLSDLEEIQTELIDANYLKRRTNKKKTATFKKSGFLKYKTSQGFEVLVGKNNKQNDEITLKIATKEDLWFHVKDMPGSHVLLKLEGNKPSDTDILEAATLAAYYSKAKNSTKAAVDYTEKKNVRKPKGAKPGMVIYDNHSTILVDGDEKSISTIHKMD